MNYLLSISKIGESPFFSFTLIKNKKHLLIRSFFPVYLNKINLKIMTLITLLFSKECIKDLKYIKNIESQLDKLKKEN